MKLLHFPYNNSIAKQKKLDFLEQLKISQLKMLLDNLRKGPKILQRYLDDKEYRELLSYDKLQSDQRELLKADAPEKSGSTILIINTLITSSFGAWFGLSGFMELGLNSKLVFFSILLFATIIAGSIGLYSFLKVKKGGESAMQEQKIANLQREAAEVLYRKEQEKAKNLIETLAKQLNIANSSYSFLITDENKFNHSASLLKFIDRLDSNHTQELDKIKNKVEEIKKQREALDQNKPIIEKMAGANVIQAKISTPRRKLVLEKMKDGLVGLGPTAIGGFASMFVILSGSRNLAKEFNQDTILQFLSSPMVKNIELGLAIAFTLYLAFSHLYRAWKSSQRQTELEKTQQSIANYEIKISNLDGEVKLLKQLKGLVVSG